MGMVKTNQKVNTYRFLINKMDKLQSGFIEQKHTADFSIFVWGKDLETLFSEAARGMFTLMDVKIENPVSDQEFIFELEEMDHESLLVSFLSELLYHLESFEFYPQKYALSFLGTRLQVSLQGLRGRMVYKEIKAVTYHNLEICHNSSGYNVTIVFDV